MKHKNYLVRFDNNSVLQNRFRKKSILKGQTQVLSAILMMGVLIAIVASVFFWGLPLIQKNKDISTLNNAESFMKNLDDKIKYIANNGGKEQFKITVPGIVSFDGDEISLVVSTQGTIYAVEAPIPLGKTSCSGISGVWGQDDPDFLCVISHKLSDQSYRQSYSLNYRRLDTTNINSYKIELQGSSNSGGVGKTITIENKGVSEKESNSRNLISTLIEIKII